MTRNRNFRQYIFPFIKFTCHGKILAWTFIAQFNGHRNSTLYPEFQIWRPYDSLYMKVAQSLINSESDLKKNFSFNNRFHRYVYTVNSSQPMLFQPGDVVGVYTPIFGRATNPRSRLLIRFINQPQDGPLSYYQLTNQSQSRFNLSHSKKATRDIPVISAQIVAFETTGKSNCNIAISIII